MWFRRQAAIGDPLVPYATRSNGIQRIIASPNWTAAQRQWLIRIGRVLRSSPWVTPKFSPDPLFAQAGASTVDREFRYGLGDVLKDLNTAIWDSTSHNGMT